MLTDKDREEIAKRKEINKKRGRGRPKKSEIQAKTKGNRGKVGRPKGDAGIMQEYKARMLASPQSEHVLNKIFEAALNDEHSHQAAAWKLLMDRMLPVGMFAQEVEKGGGKNQIQINITGVGQVDIPDQPQNDVTEGEFEEVNDD